MVFFLLRRQLRYFYTILTIIFALRSYYFILVLSRIYLIIIIWNFVSRHNNMIHRTSDLMKFRIGSLIGGTVLILFIVYESLFCYSSVVVHRSFAQLIRWWFGFCGESEIICMVIVRSDGKHTWCRI